MLHKTFDTAKQSHCNVQALKFKDKHEEERTKNKNEADDER